MTLLNPETITQEIIELQSKIAYQELTIETLNQMIVKQQFDIEKLEAQFKYISSRLQGIEPSLMAMPHEETPPPHY
ncbi:SlyX family protein [Thorsellia anophelis]|uniref:Protein SlyX n=1 Tax=Thorsellia anophelis DSM 18579 TaxID=1123402 RepID=A0A1I0E6U9_9GAMM|nr:SlyX family protein [Thorsellia anophelis]SET40154.1 SlyX protein [Thorsellia anophelis DSM 18579]